MSLDDTVRDETPTETATYADIAKLTGTEPSKISSRWREPSLTIHNMTVSGSNSEFREPITPVILSCVQWLWLCSDPTVIPATVKTQISMRIVPDQDLDSIIDTLKIYLRTQFDALRTSNELQVRRVRLKIRYFGV